MTEHHEAIADSFNVDQPRDPEWYKRAVFYEVLIRGFQDSAGNGTGDLRGLISRLDYLEWLGIDCIWLLPIYTSPLRDGGYDISDFMSVLGEYGNIGDFVTLILYLSSIIPGKHENRNYRQCLPERPNKFHSIHYRHLVIRNHEINVCP